MRLLLITADGFSLVERIHDIPPYAILSHTWGDDKDECTFRDLEEGKGRSKSGWRKLMFCSLQAKRDKLQYFWVDTCCIDKSSSAELTEAINSMFRWYQEAVKCYVYLSDVHAPLRVPASATKDEVFAWRDAFEADMKCSKWFTRGWTLQELIAPGIVEFFDAKERFVGTKETLEPLLCEITSIRVEVLQGFPLSRVRIDERISWANNRTTRREEDAAYCLLGILNVHMPLIYGEGQHNAMNRLRKEVYGEFSIKLPIAEGASFDSHIQEHNAKCLPMTRTQLLQHVENWAHDRTGKPIFWLSGMAGTGKSTIARTLARSFASRYRLGASFFFKRGEGRLGDATYFFTTIAKELMASIPEMRMGVQRAIDVDPAVFEKSFKHQFEELILRPLMRTSYLHGLEIVLVIDALDECERDEDIREVLLLLARFKEVQYVFFRVFVTSRPELPVRLGFQQIQVGAYENMILHEIPKDVVRGDIQLFIQHELGKIQEQRSLPPWWPESEQIWALVKMATPLFVFAATACRYVADPRYNPQKRLNTLLNYRTAKVSKLDATYLPVVNLLFEEEDEIDKEQWLEEFRTIVGSIILLEKPLPIRVLATLLDVSIFDVGCRLDSLHSVLSVPVHENDPVRLIHLSFRDFLVDPAKKGKSPLWIDESAVHEKLVSRCLDVMDSQNGLRRDLCRLKMSEISGVVERSLDVDTLSKSIPPVLQYACRYWTTHLKKSKITLKDGGLIHRFLQKHFLHWLEAMSLMGEIHATVSELAELRALNIETTGRRTAISRFLKDAKQFAFAVRDISEHTPLEVYSSALIFTPTTDSIRQNFSHHFATWAETISTAEANSHELIASESRANIIQDICISPNKRWIVSTSSNWTMILWDATTMSRITTLTGHWTWNSVLRFSPDSQWLACSFYDNAVRLWYAATGELHLVLRGHQELINDLAFAATGDQLSSASKDKTVRLWDIATGVCRMKFASHAAAVNALTFSRDGKLLVSASDDRTVRLWSTTEARCAVTLRGHAARITSLCISPDDQFIASTSDDATVRVWGSKTATCRWVLKGHTGYIDATTFSPDGKVLASACYGDKIILWDMTKGVIAATLFCPVEVKSIRFSSDGRHIETNRGRFSVPRFQFMRAVDDTYTKFTFFVSGEWVFYKGVRVLRLRCRHEPTCDKTCRRVHTWNCITVRDNFICMGNSSGTLTLLRLHMDKMQA